MHDKYRLVSQGSLLRNLKISIFFVHAYGFEEVHSVLVYKWCLFSISCYMTVLIFMPIGQCFFVATFSVVLGVGIGLLPSVPAVPVTYPSDRARCHSHVTCEWEYHLK